MPDKGNGSRLISANNDSAGRYGVTYIASQVTQGETNGERIIFYPRGGAAHTGRIDCRQQMVLVGHHYLYISPGIFGKLRHR